MRVILHDAALKPAGLMILAVRAAKYVMKDRRDIGSMSIVEYEDGSEFQVSVNKESVSVRPIKFAGKEIER